MPMHLTDEDYLEICRGCGVQLAASDAVLCNACEDDLARYYDRRVADEAEAQAAEEAQIDRELGITGDLHWEPWMDDFLGRKAS